MIRILIIDGHDWMKEGVKAQCAIHAGFEVVACGDDGYDALCLCEKFKPDIAIISVELGISDGFQICHSLSFRSPETAILLVADSVNHETLLKANECGALGLILRRKIFEELIPAIIQIRAEKEFYLGRGLLDYAMQLISNLTGKKKEGNKVLPSENSLKLKPISIRKMEYKIVMLMCEGLSNSEIAEQLGLKEGTVRNYISLILQKSALKQRTQIIVFALNNGFIEKNKAAQWREKLESARSNGNDKYHKSTPKGSKTV